MNFCVDFGAEDAGRLTPFKDDKPKDTENSPFEASSVLVVKARVLESKQKSCPILICTPKVRHFWRCIFLWVKQEEKTKTTRQNSKYLL